MASDAAALQTISPFLTPGYWLSWEFWRCLVSGGGAMNLTQWLSLALLALGAIAVCSRPRRRHRCVLGELFFGLARVQLLYFVCTVVIFNTYDGFFICPPLSRAGSYAAFWLQIVAAPVLTSLSVEMLACSFLVAAVGWHTHTPLRLRGWDLVGLAVVLADACFTVGIVLVPVLVFPAG